MSHFFTAEQVAQKLQVHHLTVLNLIKKKKLKAVRLGRVYRIGSEALEDFVRKNST